MVPPIASPPAEGEAAIVSDGYFSDPPHRRHATSDRYDPSLYTIDLEAPAPPYTPSQFVFPLPPRSPVSSSRGFAATAAAEPDPIRLQEFPRSPPRVHVSKDDGGAHVTATTVIATHSMPAAAATPISPRSVRSFETMMTTTTTTTPDLEKGGISPQCRRKQHRTRATAAYGQLKPFFCRSNTEPCLRDDDGDEAPVAAMGVPAGRGAIARSSSSSSSSTLRSVLIAGAVFTVAVVLILGLLFGFMKWFT